MEEQTIDDKQMSFLEEESGPITPEANEIKQYEAAIDTAYARQTNHSITPTSQNLTINEPVAIEPQGHIITNKIESQQAKLGIEHFMQMVDDVVSGQVYAIRFKKKEDMKAAFLYCLGLTRGDCWGAWTMLNNVDMIQGRPTLNTHALWGIALKHIDNGSFGEEWQIEDADDGKKNKLIYRCWCCRNGNKYTSSFSMYDAIKAGKGSSAMWQQYPKQMIQKTALSHLARKSCADIIGGSYSADEMQ